MKPNRLRLFLCLPVMLTLACGLFYDRLRAVEGSGVLASQERTLDEFSAIELASFGDVYVTVGEAQSVVVEADDNLLPLVEPRVNDGKLVIRMKPLVDIDPKLPVRVTITVRSLDAASISGSGNITITAVDSKNFRIELPGSGNISIAGKADRATVSLKGSGNILCGDLQAQSVRVDLDGSGEVTVFASERLDATIRGSGSVRYRGNPVDVNQAVSGSGSINPVP